MTFQGRGSFLGWTVRLIALCLAGAVLCGSATLFDRYGLAPVGRLACSFAGPDQQWRQQEFLCGYKAILLPCYGLCAVLSILAYWGALHMLRRAAAQRHGCSRNEPSH